MTPRKKIDEDHCVDCGAELREYRSKVAGEEGWRCRACAKRRRQKAEADADWRRRYNNPLLDRGEGGTWKTEDVGE